MLPDDLKTPDYLATGNSASLAGAAASACGLQRFERRLLTRLVAAAVCGVADATFCHNGRFIAAAKTREAALEMARIAVEQALAP